MPLALAHEQRHEHYTRQGAAAHAAASGAARPAARAGAPSAREVFEEMRSDAHPDVVPQVRKRVRHAYRETRLSPAAGLFWCVLFVQLLAVVWVKGLGMTATYESSKLDNSIADVQENIARAQKKISTATSATQLQQWAAQYGLHQATQADIDGISLAVRPTDAADSAADDASDFVNPQAVPQP